MHLSNLSCLFVDRADLGGEAESDIRIPTGQSLDGLIRRSGGRTDGRFVLEPKKTVFLGNELFSQLFEPPGMRKITGPDEINAFACPGGIIFITRGMLNLVQNEDELAAVLAHEIGHVTQKHGLKAISKARWTQVVTTLGMEAAREYTGAQLDSLVNLFEGTIDDVFQTLVVRGYGRGDEYEADKLGIACLEASGYDPIEFQNLLEILKTAQSPESGGIFSTHPNITDRIAKAKMDLKVAEGSPLPAERSARFKRIAEYW